MVTDRQTDRHARTERYLQNRHADGLRYSHAEITFFVSTDNTLAIFSLNSYNFFFWLFYTQITIFFPDWYDSASLSAELFGGNNYWGSNYQLLSSSTQILVICSLLHPNHTPWEMRHVIFWHYSTQNETKSKVLHAWLSSNVRKHLSTRWIFRNKMSSTRNTFLNFCNFTYSVGRRWCACHEIHHSELRIFRTNE